MAEKSHVLLDWRLNAHVLQSRHGSVSGRPLIRRNDLEHGDIWILPANHLHILAKRPAKLLSARPIGGTEGFLILIHDRTTANKGDRWRKDAGKMNSLA